MNQARSQQHQQSEAEGVHGEQHKNFQINATSCFRYLGNENGQKKSTFETQGTGGKGFPHRMVTKSGS